MADRLDYNTIFDNFMGTGQGSAIQDIYKIIPVLDGPQIQILNSLELLATKYDLKEVHSFVSAFKKDKSNNSICRLLFMIQSCNRVNS